MSALEMIYHLMANSDNLAADDALLAAIEQGEPAYAHPIIETLLARGTAVGMAGLARLFDQLPGEQQTIVVDSADRMLPGLRESVRSDSVQSRLNTVEILRRAERCNGAYLLVLAMRDADSGVRRDAGRALRHLAEVTLDKTKRDATADPGRDTKDAEAEMAHLIAATVDAAESYDDHMRIEAVHVAIWLADRLPERFWARLSHRPGRLSYALAETAVTSNDLRIVPFAYRAMGVGGLAQAVADSIAKRTDQAFMAEMVRHAWLLGDAAIRQGFARIRQLAWLRDGVDPIMQLPASLHARAVTMIGATGLPLRHKVDLFGNLLATDWTSLRQAAMGAVVELEGERAEQLLRSVAGWADPQLSPVAQRELVRRRLEHDAGVDRDRPTATSAAKTPQTGRIAADQPIAPSKDFQRYWASFDQLDESTRTAMSLAMVKALPETPAMLRAKLRSSDPADRARALRVITLAGLAGRFAEDIVNLSVDPDPFVRSCQVTALGRIGGTASQGILRRALYDADQRVQANAIEALERLDPPDLPEYLQRKLGDQNNRVRANAVKALLPRRVPDAARTLLEMLIDPSRMHRLSAVWLVQRYRLGVVSPRLTRISREDPDMQVRRAATRALGTLVGAEPVADQGVAT